MNEDNDLLFVRGDFYGRNLVAGFMLVRSFNDNTSYLNGSTHSVW